jgi:hypothetical protein
MPPEKPVEPLSLEYAKPVAVLPPARGLFETVGIHFGGGLGFISLIAVTLFLWDRLGSAARDPITLTYGCCGMLVILIELAVLTLAASFREGYTGCQLEERSVWRTIVAGALGAVLVYGVPWVVGHFTQSIRAEWVATLTPLILYPIAAAWFLFRPFDPARDYAGPVSVPRRAKTASELLGSWFVIGLGGTAVMFTVGRILHPMRGYPEGMVLGALLVIGIEFVLVTLAASFRDWRAEGRLEKRCAALSLPAGMLGAVLVYAAPLVVSFFTLNETALWVAMFVPGCIYPLLAAWFLFRPFDPVKDLEAPRPTAPSR